MGILAIGAHPDDVEFGCFGTLAKAQEDVYIICMTTGELSGNADVRRHEALKGAKSIGAACSVWDYPDSDLPVNTEIIDKLRDVVKRFEPTTLFIPFEQDTHQDHRAVAQIALSACNGINGIKKIYMYELPSTRSSFVPNVFIDITATFNLKLHAIAYHESQNKKPYFLDSVISGMALYRGSQCRQYGNMFEAFYGYRLMEV